MGYGRGSRSPDALGHSQVALHLIGTRLASQLLNQFYDLIDAGSAYGVASSFQPSHGGDGDFALEGYLPIFGQFDPSTLIRETAGLKG